MLLHSVFATTGRNVVDLLRHLLRIHVRDLVHRHGKTLHNTKPVHTSVVRVLRGKRQFFGFSIDAVNRMQDGGLTCARVPAEQVNYKPFQRREAHKWHPKPQKESKGAVLQAGFGVVIDDLFPRMEVAFGLEERHVGQRRTRRWAVDNFRSLDLTITNDYRRVVLSPSELPVRLLSLLMHQLVVPSLYVIHQRFLLLTKHHDSVERYDPHEPFSGYRSRIGEDDVPHTVSGGMEPQ